MKRLTNKMIRWVTTPRHPATEFARFMGVVVTIIALNLIVVVFIIKAVLWCF